MLSCRELWLGAKKRVTSLAVPFLLLLQRLAVLLPLQFSQAERVNPNVLLVYSSLGICPIISVAFFISFLSSRASSAKLHKKGISYARLIRKIKADNTFVAKMRSAGSPAS